MQIKAVIKQATRSLGFEVRRIRRGGKQSNGAAFTPAPPNVKFVDKLGSLPTLPPSNAPSVVLPTVNADGLPAILMTDEQKYAFDLKGWLCLPGVLTADQVGDIRDHIYRLHRDRPSLPSRERNECGGPGEMLLDHPAVLGILNELVSFQPLATEECYGFRLENSFSKIRRAGDSNFDPHNGGGLFAFCGNSHIYQNYPGRVHAGLTRVVWELNDIEKGDGGTLFINGSHKAAFSRPASTNDADSPFWDTYSCPAGSAIVFTEAVCHSGALWTNHDRDRVVVFNCYNTVGSKWHPGGPSREVIAAMRPKRQSLFRGVWVGDGIGQPANTFLDDANWAG